MIGALSDRETRRDDQQVAAARFIRAPVPLGGDNFKTQVSLSATVTCAYWTI